MAVVDSTGAQPAPKRTRALNIQEEVTVMKQMTPGQLQQRYADLFGEPTRSRNKAHLIRKIAWRMQALAEGGLSERARQRAEELAKQLAEDCSRGKRRVNKRTQIRKFYDEVLHLSMETQNRPDEDWQNIHPLVNMLIAKAVYAKGRDLVSDNFVEFIRDGRAGSSAPGACPDCSARP